MIEEKSFSKEWILLLRGKEGFEEAHPEIMEKMIYALYLVEKLAGHQSGLCIKRVWYFFNFDVSENKAFFHRC